MMPVNQEARLRVILLSLLIALAGIFLVTLIWGTLQYFSGVLVLFFVAWLISFILSPLANWLQDRHMPRLLAVALVYLALTVLLTGALFVVIPVIGEQISQVVTHVRALATPATLAQLSSAAQERLKALGFSNRDAANAIDQFSTNLQNSVQSGSASILTKTTDVLASFATLLLDTVIVLILSFYMMLDGRRILDGLIRRLPPTWREDVRSFEIDVARVFGGFIRSQLVIGLSYGFLTWVALVILGIPNGFSISMVTGVIMIIPFAGPYLAVLPPIALALLEVPEGDLVRITLVLLVLLFVAQQLVMQVLAPRIMSHGVGLHPLWLFAALLAGARIAGVWGAFFAPPVAALVAIIIGAVHSRWAKRSPLFQIPEQHAATPPQASSQ